MKIVVETDNGLKYELQAPPGVVVTTNLFWDCTCEHRFIQSKSVQRCPFCGDEALNNPDSRIDEIVLALLERLDPEELKLRNVVVRMTNCEKATLPGLGQRYGD